MVKRRGGAIVMKYTINVSPVFYWEGLEVELETEANETEELAKVTRDIYDSMMKAFQPIIQAQMAPVPQTQCTCQQQTSSETSFKEVEEETPVEAPKKATSKKEKTGTEE